MYAMYEQRKVVLLVHESVDEETVKPNNVNVVQCFTTFMCCRFTPQQMPMHVSC